MGAVAKRSVRNVWAEVGDGGRVTFTLAAETDAQRGTLDLTPVLADLIEVGAAHPRTPPDSGVTLGEIETEGDLRVTIDGRTLADEEIIETLGAGFAHAIRLAIEEDRAVAKATAEGSGATVASKKSSTDDPGDAGTTIEAIESSTIEPSTIESSAI
jgi:hypothetical protein